MCTSLKMSKYTWKVIFGVILSLIFLKAVLETTYIIISSKKIRLNKTRLPLIVNEQADPRSINQFRVLLWTKWYQFKWMDVLDRHPKCEFTNCVFTDDRTNWKSFDAIVFHWYNIEPKDLPQQVIDHQKWVLFNMESPHYTGVGFNSIGLKKIDWTMSYRNDSDIFTPYGQVVKCSPKWKPKYNFENKTKSIAWFVSHCKTASKREVFAKKLGQYIDVDIYGGCGHLQCRKYDNNCIDMISHKYKFYLSFENSICKDYVTEKAFHYMQYDIIPVVLGGANYSAILPPNSYIDALNFTSVRHLADYLKRVATDRSLYETYFEWKYSFCISRVDHNRNLCQLCKRLNTGFKSNGIQNIQNRKKWWNDSNCRTIKFKNDTIELVKA